MNGAFPCLQLRLNKCACGGYYYLHEFVRVKKGNKSTLKLEVYFTDVSYDFIYSGF